MLYNTKLTLRHMHAVLDLLSFTTKLHTNSLIRKIEERVGEPARYG